jgi:hypothetical protein
MKPRNLENKMKVEDFSILVAYFDLSGSEIDPIKNRESCKNRNKTERSYKFVATSSIAMYEIITVTAKRKTQIASIKEIERAMIPINNLIKKLSTVRLGSLDILLSFYVT